MRNLPDESKDTQEMPEVEPRQQKVIEGEQQNERPEPPPRIET